MNGIFLFWRIAFAFLRPDSEHNHGERIRTYRGNNIHESKQVPQVIWSKFSRHVVARVCRRQFLPNMSRGKYGIARRVSLISQTPRNNRAACPPSENSPFEVARHVRERDRGLLNPILLFARSGKPELLRFQPWNVNRSFDSISAYLSAI